MGDALPRAGYLAGLWDYDGTNVVAATNQGSVTEIFPDHAGPEIVFAGFDGRIHCVDASAHPICESEYTTSDRVLTGGVAIADLSGDGTPEIVFATYSPDMDQSYLFVMSASDEVLHRVALPMRGSMAVPTIAHVDGDGALEIVVDLKDGEDRVESGLVFTCETAWCPEVARATEVDRARARVEGAMRDWRFSLVLLAMTQLGCATVGSRERSNEGASAGETARTTRQSAPAAQQAEASTSYASRPARPSLVLGPWTRERIGAGDWVAGLGTIDGSLAALVRVDGGAQLLVREPSGWRSARMEHERPVALVERGEDALIVAADGLDHDALFLRDATHTTPSRSSPCLVRGDIQALATDSDVWIVQGCRDTDAVELMRARDGDWDRTRLPTLDVRTELEAAVEGNGTVHVIGAGPPEGDYRGALRHYVVDASGAREAPLGAATPREARLASCGGRVHALFQDDRRVALALWEGSQWSIGRDEAVPPIRVERLVLDAECHPFLLAAEMWRGAGQILSYGREGWTVSTFAEERVTSPRALAHEGVMHVAFSAPDAEGHSAIWMASAPIVAQPAAANASAGEPPLRSRDTPRVVRGEWTHAPLCGRPGSATGIVARGDRVVAVCDDMLGSQGARRYERSGQGWTPSTLARGGALDVTLDGAGTLVTLLAEPSGDGTALTLRLRSGESSDTVRRIDALDGIGEVVVRDGRTIIVQGLRSPSILERGPSGWQTLGRLDGFGRTSSALDDQGRLHVLYPSGNVIAHRVIDRDGHIATGELDSSGGAGVLGVCGGTLYAALGTMHGIVLASLDRATWQREDGGVAGTPRAIGFDAGCRPFIADTDGVLARGRGGWVRAPFGPERVATVSGVAASATEIHVLYERDTSPREVWVASAALGEP